MQDFDDLDEFTQGYVECAYWLAEPNPSPGEFFFDPELWPALSDGDRKSMVDSCRKFQAENSVDLRLYTQHSGRDARHAGHDFYLSRNRRGAGYFDRGKALVFERLQAAAQRYGEQGLTYYPGAGGCESYTETGECRHDECVCGGTYGL